MQLHLIAYTHAKQTWLETGCEEYLKRMRNQWDIQLNYLSPRQQESEAQLIKRFEQSIPTNAHCIVLDVAGKPWDNQALLEQVNKWEILNKPIALLIGGADGLPAAIRARGQQQWSISSLILPHDVVRLIVLEQLYRTFTLQQNHPYHRG